MKSRIIISLAFIFVAACGIWLPYKSCQVIGIFGGLSDPTSYSIISSFDSSLPGSILIGLVFIPAFLVFVKPRATVFRIVLSVVLVLLLAGGAAFLVGGLMFTLLEDNVHYLVGFYISAALAIFSPMYALWLSWNSSRLFRRNRRQMQPVPEYCI